MKKSFRPLIQDYTQPNTPCIYPSLNVKLFLDLLNSLHTRCVCVFDDKITFSKDSFGNNIIMSSSLYQDQNRPFVGPDPVPNCLQLNVNNTRKMYGSCGQRVSPFKTTDLKKVWANNVDSDDMAHTGHLIWIYTVCLRILLFSQSQYLQCVFRTCLTHH